MTAFLKDWLLGVVAAALAVSVAQALTPAGTVKKVGRLVGGLVLLLAVARPLLRMDVTAWDLPVWDTVDLELQTQENQKLLEDLIAGQVQTYIEETEGEIKGP